VSHPSWEEQKEVVDQVLSSLGLSEYRTVLVFNKIDRLTHAEEEAWRDRAAALYDAESVFVSAATDGGLQPLRDLLLRTVRERRAEVRIHLPATEGRMLAEIYRQGEVLHREDEGDLIHLRARVPQPMIGRLRQSGVAVYDGA
jgi:GTPase